MCSPFPYGIGPTFGVPIAEDYLFWPPKLATSCQTLGLILVEARLVVDVTIGVEEQPSRMYGSMHSQTPVWASPKEVYRYSPLPKHIDG